MLHISVQRLRKDENKYYEDLLEFGWKNLLLFPYHLSDIIIKKLSVTPFHYYINMLDSQMAQEKSYDSLPNFTAGNYVYYFILFYSYRYLRAVRKLCRLGRGEGGSPKDDLLHRPYIIKKTTRGEKLPILRRHSL